MSSGWFCCQWLYPGRVPSHVPGQVHVTATAESSTAWGSPRTGVQPWGGQRKGRDSRRQGQDLMGTVFNCLVVISEILLCAAVARVMKKIKYMRSHILQNPEMLYLFVQYLLMRKKKRVHLSYFTLIQSIIFCSSINLGMYSFNYIKSKASNTFEMNLSLYIWNDSFFILLFLIVKTCSWKARVISWEQPE